MSTAETWAIISLGVSFSAILASMAILFWAILGYRRYSRQAELAVATAQRITRDIEKRRQELEDLEPLLQEASSRLRQGEIVSDN